MGWAAIVLVLGACDWGGPSYWLRKYEGEIAEGTRAIDTAKTDAQRAQGYVRRARGYSEKARYSRAFKLIATDEYKRLFDLAIADHDRAVALAPQDAQTYLSRGLTIYDRAALEEQADPGTRAWYDAARADFTEAIARDDRNEQAFDMRGLVNTSRGKHDDAIGDFTAVMRLNPRAGKLRLAEEYCTRGSVFQREKKFDQAIADYETAIGFGVPADSCDCQPDAALAWIYFDLKQYDKSWQAVHRAQKERRWIPDEFLEQLKRASGRTA